MLIWQTSQAQDDPLSTCAHIKHHTRTEVRLQKIHEICTMQAGREASCFNKALPSERRAFIVELPHR